MIPFALCVRRARSSPVPFAIFDLSALLINAAIRRARLVDSGRYAHALERYLPKFVCPLQDTENVLTAQDHSSASQMLRGKGSTIIPRIACKKAAAPGLWSAVRGESR